MFVPGGSYPQGSSSIDEDSKPIHQVVLSPFWIGKLPVTRAQYNRFLEAVPTYRKPRYWQSDGFNAPNQPIVAISWDDAQAYVRWAGFELPSEAQWEAAARGPDGRAYPWGDQLPTAELADFDKSYKTGQPDPVGSHPKGAGPFGTQDQAGGVWEWCEDAWNPRAYDGRDGRVDPVERVGTDRLVRGGSWGNPARSLRSAFRYGEWADGQSRDLGFRVMWRPG